MKKLLVVLLMLAVMGTVVFAGSSGENSSLPTLGVAIYKFDDTFMSYVRNAIAKNAEGKANVNIVDSQNTQPTQNDQVDQFITRKVKAIAINPVDRTAAGAIITKARSANLPVVFFNREPFADDMRSWDKVYYVGAKAEESGTMQGDIAADYWIAQGKQNTVLRYIMLKGEPGHQDAELRTEYSVKQIQARGIRVQELAVDTAMWDRPRAVEKMDAFWARFGNQIDMVLCNNDDMALGVIESLKKVGIFSGGRYIPVLGVDATAPALQALAEGTLLGTVLNDAQNQGKATFDLTYALATGANPANAGWTLTDGKYVWVPYQKVTKDNFRQFQ
ncbi:MAG: galactose/glucose ABC transporter substrate-binding protein MglB [Treponema sp.]|jgi:methyl-galactoside transport system substrate-binding protein|nr:galactose/glucose ABC transporter substrate-binding protein MglB [Treponema sp.]